MSTIQYIICALFIGSLGILGCEPKEETGGSEPSSTEAGGACTPNVDPNDSVHMCSGDDLLWCVCDNYQDNMCPDQQGTWVVQDILCTCPEWEAGDCPIE